MYKGSVFGAAGPVDEMGKCGKEETKRQWCGTRRQIGLGSC